MSERISYPPIEPFETGLSPKEQALKVLEEASELVEAVKGAWDDDALYEFADTLQAMGNLAHVMDWTNDDLNDAYRCVHASNLERGRYGDGR